jgi:hypothetical protein
VSEPMPESPPEPANPPAEGPIGHLDGWFHAHGAHAEAEAGHIATDIATGLREHAAVAFRVSSEILDILGMIDPADAPLIAAAQALEPKVYAMAERAASLAAAALKGS